MASTAQLSASTGSKDGIAAVPPVDDYVYVDGPSQHWIRRREILAKYPAVRSLMTRNAWSALWVVVLVSAQWGIASFVGSQGWLWLVVLAYLVGAVINHALYVQIHECTHNLVFERPSHNKLLGMVCDFALAIPGAMAFRKYHLLHHKYLGQLGLDPDIVLPSEARLMGRSAWRKALWMFFLGISQALRPHNVKSIDFWDRWIVANLVVQILVDVGIFLLLGPAALAYLALSTLFALGLHPLGGRWIQEHYVTREGQETYSYYGILNRLCFNMGYHNEHHDFANVPWNNLPKLRALAPEYYDSLKSYRSWTGVVLRFIFDPRMSGFSRIVHVRRG